MKPNENSEIDKKAVEKTSSRPKNLSAQNASKQKEADRFKRQYFDFYDDIKISVKEDW